MGKKKKKKLGIVGSEKVVVSAAELNELWIIKYIQQWS